MGTTRSAKKERGTSSGGEPADPADVRSAGSQGRGSRGAAASGAEASKATAETKKRQKEPPTAAGEAPAAAVGTGLRCPTSTSRGPPGGASRAAAVTSSAETGGSPRKRSKPSGSGGSAGGSAAKRPKAPGILTTALGWARSQAADLAAFEQDRAAEGPVRPPPPLPLPTRRLAAAQHDMMKAMHQQQGRGGQGRNTRTASAPGPRNAAAQLPHAAPAPPGVHPAAVAFAAGSDPQMAAMVSTELTRLSAMAQADPQRYNALADECRAWAAGSLPTVAGLTSADLERAQKELHAAMTVQHRGGGGAGRPAGPPDPRASSYFIQPFPDQDPLQASLRIGNMPFMSGPVPYGGGGGGGGGEGGGNAQRYPRRSSRGRNVKRDELYLTLDSEEEGGVDEEDDGVEEGGARLWSGGGAAMPPPPGARRGPGRPRKHPLPHPLPSQIFRRGSTPKAPSPLGGLFMPPAGAVLHPSDAVLSPFAQFLLDQDVGAGPNSGYSDIAGIGADAVDFSALDDFISGLNFTNDALLLGSPGALAVVQVAKALSPPGTRPPGPMSAAAPGPLPAARQLLPPDVLAAAAPAAVPEGAPLQAGGRTDMPPPPPTGHIAPPSGAGTSAAAGLVGPSSVPPPPPLQILELDLAACKPLETPTLAGMLSLAGPRKASTPGTSPATDLLKSPLLSPTLLALNF